MKDTDGWLYFIRQAALCLFQFATEEIFSCISSGRLYRPQTLFAGRALSIILGYAKFKLLIICLNSTKDFVSLGLYFFSSPIEEQVNPVTKQLRSKASEYITIIEAKV